MTRDEILSEIRRLAGASNRAASDTSPAVSGDVSGTTAAADLTTVLARVPAGDNGIPSLDALTTQIAELRQAVTQQNSTLEENSKATADNTAARLRDVAQVGRDFLSNLGGGSGLGSALLGSPLIGAISRLFRRSAPAAPAPLPTFEAPAALQLEAALPADSVDGLRTVTPAQGGELRASTVSQPAVTVQVQTMDSRSFLDNSDQIARAVKEALLNMHSLSDVVGDL